MSDIFYKPFHDVDLMTKIFRLELPHALVVSFLVNADTIQSHFYALRD